MKHNFADWELTQLLPENTFNNSYDYWYLHKYGSMEVNNRYAIYDHNDGRLLDGYEEYIKAWTWEDIRLYLESNKMFINIEHRTLFNTDNLDITDLEMCGYQATIKIYKDRSYDGKLYAKDCYSHDVTLPSTFKSYSTYEEARIEGIKYCLNLINKK